MIKNLLLLGCIATMIACTPSKKSTIDTNLQTKVDSILQNKMSEINAISGQAIVMDIQTGEIKAMVGNGQKQLSSLMRAVSVHNALKTGRIGLSDTIDTEQGITVIYGDTIKDHNWYRDGYSKIPLKQGLALESEIAVSKALQIAGVEAVDSLVTPLEMLMLFNDLIKNDSLKSAFRYCVTDGLGKPAASDKVEVGGLSGKRIISEYNLEYVVEFCGYFPADEPKYSIIVSMNKIDIPASGGSMAGSVFKEVVDYMNFIY